MSKANKTRQQDERAPPAAATRASSTTRSPMSLRRQPTPGSSEAALGAQTRSPPLASPLGRSGSASMSPPQRVVTTLSQRMLQYTSGAGARAAVTNYTMGTAVMSPNGSRAYFTQSKQAIVAQASPYSSPPRARAVTPLATIDLKPGDHQSLTTDEDHSTDTRESMVTHTGRTTGRTSVSDGAETSEGLPSTASAGNDVPTSLLSSSKDTETINKSVATMESGGASKAYHSRTDYVTAGQLPDIRNGEDTNASSNTARPAKVLEEATDDDDDDDATATEKLPVGQWHAVHDFPDNGPTASTDKKTAANDSGAIIESSINQSVNQGNSTNGVIQTLGDSSVDKVPAQTADLIPPTTARISSTGSDNSDGSAAAGEGGTETRLEDESASTKMTRLSPISVSSAKNRAGKSTPSSAGSAASDDTVKKKNAAAQKPSVSVTEMTAGDTKTSYSGSRTTVFSTTTKSGQVTKSLSGSKNTPTAQTAGSLASTQASDSTRAATTSALKETPEPTEFSVSTFENKNPENPDTNTGEEMSRENKVHNIDRKAESMQSIAKTGNMSPKSVTLSGTKASDSTSSFYESTTKTGNAKTNSSNSPTAASRPTESVANTKFSPSIVSSQPKASDAQTPSVAGSATTRATTKTAISIKSQAATSRATDSVVNTTRFSPSIVSSGPKPSETQGPSLTGSDVTHATTKTAANTTRFSPSAASDSQAPSLTGSEMTHATTKTAVSTKSPAATSRPTESIVDTTTFSPSIAPSATKASDEQAPSFTGSETTQATAKTAVTPDSFAATSIATESMADITTFSPSLAPSGPNKSGGETSSLAGSATTKATTKTAVTSESPAATSRPTESVANTTKFSPSSVSAETKASDEQAPSLTGSHTTQATAKSAVTTKSPTATSRQAGSVGNTTRFSPSIVSTAQRASDEKASSLIGSETTQGTTKTAGTAKSLRKTFEQTESVANTSISPSIVSSLPNQGDQETPSLTGTATTQGHVKTSDPAATSRPAESVTNTTNFSPSVVSSAPKASGEQTQSLPGSATTHASTKRTVATKSTVATATPTESVANTTTFSPSIVSSAPKTSEKKALSLKESTATQATTKISGTSSSPTGASKQTDSVANTAKSSPLTALYSPKASTEQEPSLTGSITTQTIAKTSDGNKSQTSGPTESVAFTATYEPSIVPSVPKPSEERAPSFTESMKTQATAKASDVRESPATTSRPTESVANSTKFSPSIESSEQAASKKQSPSLTGSATTQATAKTAVSTKNPTATSTATESVAITAKDSPSAVSSARRTADKRAPSLTESAATHATTKMAKTSKSPTDTSRPTELAANTTAHSPSSVSSAKKKGVNDTTSSTGSATTQATTNVAAINRSPAATLRSPSPANATKHPPTIVSSATQKYGEESRALSGSATEKQQVTTIDPSPAGLVDAITEVAMRGASRTALQSKQSVPESRTSVIVRNPTRGTPPLKIKKTPVSTASVSVFEGTWPSISTPVILVNPSLTSAPHEVTAVRTTATPSTPATHGQFISGELDLNERRASARASERVKASGSVSGTPVTATPRVVRHDDGARRLTAASSGARAVTQHSGTFPAEQLAKEMLMTAGQAPPFSTGAPPPLRSSLITGLGTAQRRISDAARAEAAAAQQDFLRSSLILPESQAAILLANVALGAAEAATIALQEVALGISTVGVDHGGIGVEVGHRGSGRRPADGFGNEGLLEPHHRAQAIAADLAGRVEDMAAAAAAAVASDVAAASQTISQHAASAVARTLLHDRRRSESGVTRGSSRDSMSDRGTVIRVQGPAVTAVDIDDGRRAATVEMQVRPMPNASPASSSLVASGPPVIKPEKSTIETRRQADAQPSHSRAAAPTQQPPGTAALGASAFPPDWNAPAVPPHVSDPAGELRLFETAQAQQQERRMSVKLPLLAMNGTADHLGPPLRIRLWTSFNPRTGPRPSQQQQQPLSSQQTLRRETDGTNRQQRRGSQPAAESREKNQASESRDTEASDDSSASGVARRRRGLAVHGADGSGRGRNCGGDRWRCVPASVLHRRAVTPTD